MENCEIKKFKKAFTLVELIIVISIPQLIMALIGQLWPTPPPAFGMILPLRQTALKSWRLATMIIFIPRL